MRIAFLAPCKDLSGGIKVIATYAQMLQERGHDVSVVYPKKQLSLKRSLKKFAFKQLGLEKDHLDYFTGHLHALEAITNQTVPDGDILIATAWETAEWARDLSDSKGRKFYFVQGHEVWNADKDRVYATLRLPMQKITISSWLQKLMREISGDQDIQLIPNGVDDIFLPSLSTDVDRKYDVGLVYSVIPNKGCDLGITALKKLSTDNPHLRFVIFGTEAPLENLPANTTVFVKPSRKKIAEIYQQTQIWLSTSYEEGFCLPCLEAMRSGCAVVSTDNKGVRDIIQQGKSGFITLPGRSDELIEHALKLLANSDLMKKVQKEAVLRSQKFNWQDSVLELEQALLGQSQEMAA